MQKEVRDSAQESILPPDHLISEICGAVSIAFASFAAIHNIDNGPNDASSLAVGVAALYTCLGILGLKPDSHFY